MKLFKQANTSSPQWLFGQHCWRSADQAVEVLVNPHPIAWEDGDGGIWKSRYLVYVREALVGEANTLAEAAQLAAA